jgi:hypothetical protein
LQTSENPLPNTSTLELRNRYRLTFSRFATRSRLTLAGWRRALHPVQAWLAHTNISQTSTYLAVRDDGGDVAMARFDALRQAMPPLAKTAQASVIAADTRDVDSEDLQETCKAQSETWLGGRDSNPERAVFLSG